MVESAKLGWMAAVVDLKGMIIRKKNQTRATPQLVLAVESRDFNVIKHLALMSGGHPEAKRVQDPKSKDWMRRNCTEHCPDAHVHGAVNMPVTQRWTLTGAAAAVVLYNLRPYLVADKPYEKFISEALGNMVLSGPGSGAVRSALTRLVALGWELPPALGEDLLEIAAWATAVPKAVSA